MAGQVEDFEYAGIANHVVFGAGACGGPAFRRRGSGLGVTRLLVVAAEAEAGLADRIESVLGGLIVARFSRVLAARAGRDRREARAAAR